MPKSIKDLKMYQDVSFKQLDIPSDETKDPTVIYIEGYATVIAKEDGSKYIDRDGEHVSIDLLKTSNYVENPVIVFNHDWGDVMGKCTSLVKNEKGLQIKAEVHKLTGRENVFEAVQKGLIKTFSIGFLPESFTYLEEEDAFEISSAELVEISLAPVPANAKALFNVTATKSLSIDKSLLQEQTKMSCDELTGICTLSKAPNIKGKSMKTKNPEVKEPEVKEAEVAAESQAAEKKEPATENKEPEATKEPEVTKEKDPEPAKKENLSVEELAVEIVKANQIAEEQKAEQARIAKEQEEKDKLAKEEAEKQKVEEALAYIKTRKEAIENTPASELNVDELEDFYELISDTAALIDAKVLEIVEKVQAQ